MHTPSPKLNRAAKKFMDVLRAEYEEAGIGLDGEFQVEFHLEHYGEDFTFKSKTSPSTGGDVE